MRFRPASYTDAGGGAFFHPLQNERGMALLIAIVVVVLLVTLIVEFDYGTRISLITAGTFRNGTQATFLAKSGVRAAQAVLKNDGKISPGVDHLEELWATPVPPYPVGNGMVSVHIEDEQAKLNVNLLQKTTDYEKWKPVWERLFDQLEIEREVVAALKDWEDEDDIPEDLGGAEASYYERLTPPYRIRNGPIESLGELLLIKGITKQVYKKLMTACDGGPCVTIAPTEKINLNTVSGPVCVALHEDLSEQLCERLLEGRPFEQLTEVDAVAGWGGTGGGAGSGSGIRAELNSLKGGYIAVNSNYFFVRAIGEVQESRRIAESLIKRQGNTATLLSWRIR